MGNWKYTLKGFQQVFDEHDDLEERARLIVRKLDRFQNQHGEDDWLESIIEDFNIFTNDDSESYFDQMMSELYDWADHKRVWIEPRSSKTK